MALIGVDPHKASHTAVAIDADETVLDRLQVRSDAKQCERLLSWADRFDERSWAIESAAGLGHLLSQQLVAAGEQVVDVPATLSARVRVLGSGRSSKNDPNDALATAIAALRHSGLRVVTAEDHTAICRLLASRYRQLQSDRQRTICRLHAVLTNLTPGGFSSRLNADRAGLALRRIHPTNAVEAERKQIALDYLVGLRRVDRDLAQLRARMAAAVTAADTTVTDIFGVGPIAACLILGHTGDVTRFATADRYASYNATAPVEASSGPTVRHRLNLRGNRQLNHAMHIAAIAQMTHDGPGRIYYDRKITEKKRHKDALRALKRRISDNVYRHLVADAARHRA
jgi:transposase